MNSFTVQNKTFTYDTNTTFQVQVGKGDSKYKNRYTFVGDFRQAIFYYQCINIGYGYKKRLLLNGKCVIRSFS